MAKIKSLFKIEGTLDELTFYKTPDGHYVRMKGGVSKDRILNDPAYVRTRENMREFAHVSKTGKSFRNVLGSLLKEAKDSRLAGRMTRVLSQVKKLDTQSARGDRKISLGMGTAEAKQLWTGFDFNRHAPLQQVLSKTVQVDLATATFSLTGLIPAEDLHVPEGATHVSFLAAHLRYDFDTGIGDLQLCNTVLLPIDMQSSDVSLVPGQLASGAGISFYLFGISFYQAVNQNMYSLRNGRFNVLNILAVS